MPCAALRFYIEAIYGRGIQLRSAFTPHQGFQHLLLEARSFLLRLMFSIIPFDNF